MGDTNFITMFFRVSIACLLMALGIYEAVVAASNHNNLTPNEETAYIFTSIKASINMCISLVECCTCAKQNDKSTLETQCSAINLGLLIWVIIMYSDMINNTDIYGPFGTVVYIEFIVAIIWLSILGILMILCCCSCFLGASFIICNKATQPVTPADNTPVELGDKQTNEHV